MRLDGKAEILRYLGRSVRSTHTCHSVLLRYGSVVRVNYPRIKTGMREYWCQSEDLDAVDRARSVTAWDDHGKTKLVDHVTTLHACCRNAKRGGAIW